MEHIGKSLLYDRLVAYDWAPPCIAKSWPSIESLEEEDGVALNVEYCISVRASLVGTQAELAQEPEEVGKCLYLFHCWTQIRLLRIFTA